MTQVYQAVDPSCDVVIVGAGGAGRRAAFEAGHRRPGQARQRSRQA
jgi:succinate dehydrogenase/fumarate reductase flavoprotein subunit